MTGFRLRMGASGIKTYILRNRVQGKWLNVTIGRHGSSFTLVQCSLFSASPDAFDLTAGMAMSDQLSLFRCGCGNVCSRRNRAFEGLIGGGQQGTLTSVVRPIHKRSQKLPFNWASLAGRRKSGKGL